MSPLALGIDRAGVLPRVLDAADCQVHPAMSGRGMLEGPGMAVGEGLVQADNVRPSSAMLPAQLVPPSDSLYPDNIPSKYRMGAVHSMKLCNVSVVERYIPDVWGSPSSDNFT